MHDDLQEADLPVPAILRDGVGSLASGRDWIARLPELVARAVDRWGLTLEAPFVTGRASWCAPARTADGRDAVLKVVFPHDEARCESAVLRAWAGRGAVQVIDACASDWALLLERVRPGTPLSADVGSPSTQLLVAASVLRSLTAEDLVADGLEDLPTMVAVGRRWAELIVDRGARAVADGELRPDVGLVSEAAGLMRDLPLSPDRLVVVHGDVNPGNLLRVADGRWVVIDPKPMVGDLAYDPWPLLEQVDDPFRAADPAALLVERTALVADELGLDPARVGAWALARTVESALWDWAERGDVRGARAGFARAAIWAAVAR